MRTYKIEFLTLDGNINYVLIDSSSEERAILKFESEYSFEAVRKCIEVE